MSKTIGDRVYAKVALRLVLLLTTLIVFSSIDRVNISFAALQMNADLGLSKKAYGLGVSLFFVGYLLFQLPSMSLLKRAGAKAWVAVTVIAWGLISLAMAFAQDAVHFYVLRFMLGLAESGFAPGVIAYLSRWLPQKYRGRAVGYTLLSVPISVMIGGPLSGALMQIAAFDIAGWRWMFALEGTLTLLMSLLAVAVIVDHPNKARWLSDEETQWIEDEIASEKAKAGKRADQPFGQLIRDPALWLLAGVWFALLTGSNALMFWMPQALKSLTDMGVFMIGVVSALPWVGLGLGMWFNARHSDARNERLLHVAVPAVIGAMALAAVAFSGSSVTALGFVIFGALAMGAAQAVFWTLPTQVFAGAPQALATINMCGNMSGILTPLAIGAVIDQTGQITLPVYGVAVVLGLGALFLIPIARLGAKVAS